MLLCLWSQSIPGHWDKRKDRKRLEDPTYIKLEIPSCRTIWSPEVTFYLSHSGNLWFYKWFGILVLSCKKFHFSHFTLRSYIRFWVINYSEFYGKTIAVGNGRGKLWNSSRKCYLMNQEILVFRLRFNRSFLVSSSTQCEYVRIPNTLSPTT